MPMIPQTTDRTRQRFAAEDFVSVDEAALLLGRSLRTLRYWEKAGHMPPRKRFGRRLMYRRQDIARLTEDRGEADA